MLLTAEVSAGICSATVLGECNGYQVCPGQCTILSAACDEFSCCDHSASHSLGSSGGWSGTYTDTSYTETIDTMGSLFSLCEDSALSYSYSLLGVGALPLSISGSDLVASWDYTQGSISSSSV